MYIGCAQVQRGGEGPDHPPWKIHTFLFKIAIGPPFPRKELEPPGKYYPNLWRNFLNVCRHVADKHTRVCSCILNCFMYVQ